MSDFICDGPVTKDLLEKLLQEFFRTDSKLIKCDGTVISKDLGVTSEVIRIQLQWNRSQNLPSKVIIKAPLLQCFDSYMDKSSIGENEQSAKPVMSSSETMVRMIHKTECEAYKVLYKANPPPIPVPLIYAIRENDPGLIMMEDLGDKANIIENVARGLTFDQWRSITIHLAQLHAWSLTTDINWKEIMAGPEMLVNMFKAFEQISRQGLKASKEKYPEYFSHVDESLYEKEITGESFERNVELYRQFMPDVMIHGDTWINNIMLLRDNKDPNQLTDKVSAFLDWQLSSRGCGLTDLARLTCFVPHELRRSRIHEILKIYFDEFRAKSGKALADCVTFVDAWKVFSHMSAVNGLIGVMMADHLLNSIGKVHEDPTGGRQTELLTRTKAGYDDAATYFRTRYENSTNDL